MMIRAGRVDERLALEDLQRRALLVHEGHRRQLLDNPDSIELPRADLADGHVRVAETDGCILGFSTVLARVPRLFVLDAALYVPDYAPALGADTLAELGLEPDEDPFLLLVSSLRDDGPAVNLAAPIAVNGRTGSATQIVLDGQDWPLRQTLSPR